MRIRKGTVKVETLDASTAAEIRSFFGTKKAAYAQLNLSEAGLSWLDFDDVMLRKYQAPAKVSLVRNTWDRFKKEHNVTVKPIPKHLQPAPKAKTRRLKNRQIDTYIVETNREEPFRFLE